MHLPILGCNTFHLQTPSKLGVQHLPSLRLSPFPPSGASEALPSLGQRWFVFPINVCTTLPRPAPTPPPIMKQLVLELEGRVSVLELWSLLPCRTCSRLTHPLHQNFLHTTVETGAHDLLWMRPTRPCLIGGRRGTTAGWVP
jgi:hypothetical protein